MADEKFLGHVFNTADVRRGKKADETEVVSVTFGNEEAPPSFRATVLLTPAAWEKLKHS